MFLEKYYGLTKSIKFISSAKNKSSKFEILLGSWYFFLIKIIFFLGTKKMSCFAWCNTSDPRIKRSLRRSIGDYHGGKTLAAFANMSFKTDSGKRKFIEEIARLGKGNITSKAFSFRELCAATQNFHPSNVIGEGGFGRVYKGYLKSTDQVVAVKQLDRNGFQGNREFFVEVLVLSLLKHPNLVNLVGYCAEGEQRILVYEYMVNGSLEDHLLDIDPDRTPLDWQTRIKIAEGAAKGLEYLHEIANPPVIYRDFKASNILLDENFNPKLSDFGLAKVGILGDEMAQVSTRVMGTYGYCAPEYASTGQLTIKSDVYSFGVVFLEMITGRRVIDNSRKTEEANLVLWAQPLLRDRRKFVQIADPLLENKYPIKGLYQALAIAAMCLQEEAETRPWISDVVTALSFLATKKVDGDASLNDNCTQGGDFSGDNNSNDDENGDDGDNNKNKIQDENGDKDEEKDINNNSDNDDNDNNDDVKRNKE
ncbi:probable serine/threonine-protein kinase PBL23 [Arachis ipaensis]|uniref:Protein kinase domain-containing protein n=1 Tax=Arachis hypogaea TaxID=3818 RepID=A0A445AM26_ARAHY|nr:probable serine/threonine-protein kinase PBL23 [Arachis ipaensis]XP_025626234.1 probable serine/threonine-protein kinase PBL23 [Arachis hypogaea]RYR27455.1 hypothetical protein Ahy_B01g051487 [Arachis hypogaea]